MNWAPRQTGLQIEKRSDDWRKRYWKALDSDPFDARGLCLALVMEVIELHSEIGAIISVLADMPRVTEAIDAEIDAQERFITSLKAAIDNGISPNLREVLSEFSASNATLKTAFRELTTRAIGVVSRPPIVNGKPDEAVTRNP